MGLKRSLVLLLAVFCVLLVVACGNSSKPIAVTVTPSISSTTVPAGSSSVTLSATVANDSNNGGVTWALSPATGCGTLSGSGSSATYTPPSAATLNSDCTATITATSASDSTKTSNLALTIKAITVSVSSSTQTTMFGSGAPNVTLTATLNNEATGAGDTVNWSITSAAGTAASRIIRPQVVGLTSNCGTLVPNGTSATYIAPTSIASQCTATITAASTINSHQTKTTTFTINPIVVAITAPASSVTQFADKGNIALTSSVTNDGANAGLTWSVNGCGTVSGNASGATYTPPTAPSAQCTAVVTATSVTDPTKSASGPTFTINPIVGVALSGVPSSIAESATTNVSATVTNDIGGQGVTWAVTPSGCGTLTNVTATGATYNAPTSLGGVCQATVTATSKADGTKTASTTIVVRNTTVRIDSPVGAQNLAANAGNVTLQATIFNDGSNQGITWSLSPATGCGTITGNNTSATYAPPAESGMSAACTAIVTAASKAEPLATSGIAITEYPVSVSGITGAPSQGVAQHSAAIPLSTTVSYDASNSGVAFVLTSGASCGSLGAVSNNGYSYSASFTPAPSVSANCVATVAAQSVYDNARAQQVNITVLPLTVTITSPANNTSVTVNTTTTITASVSNDVGSGAVIYTLSAVPPALTCGQINASGPNTIFTAPATPGCSAIVTATAVNDNTKSASVTLNVVAAPISVSIAPQGPYGIDASNNNGQSQLNLTGTIQNDINNQGLSWNTDNPACGTILGGVQNSVPGGMATFTAANDSGLTSSCVTNIWAASVADPSKQTQKYQMTVYPISVGITPNSPQTVEPGGTPINFTANVNNDALPGPGTGSSGVSWSLVNNNNCATPGTLSNQTTTSATYTPPASGSCQLMVQANSVADGTKYANVSVNVQVTTPLVINTTQNDVNSGLAGFAYTLYVNASGGSGNFGNYQFTYTGLPSWLAPAQNNSSELVGTPTAAGSWPITVSVKDTVTNQTAGPVSLTVTVNAGPDGAHNSYLNGRYSCLLNGYVDADGSRWASLVTFVANGSGGLTNGVFTSQGRTLGLVNGTFSTGTYSVDTSNNAFFQPSDGLVKTGTTSPLYFMSVGNVVSGVANNIQIIEADDQGASPSGTHGNGFCYRADSTAFTTALSGGYVLSVGGEDGAGSPKAAVGQIAINTNTIVSGTIDQVKGITYATATLGGSIATPDTTGKFTGALSVSGKTPGNWLFYIIDAKRLLMMQTDSGGASSGELRKQQQTSYSMTNFAGPFVVYEHAVELASSGSTPGSVLQYDTFIAQGVGTGGANPTMTFNTSVDASADASGNANPLKLNDPNSINQAMPVSLTASTGRVAISTGSTGGVYIYLYDNNKAVFLDNSGGSDGTLTTTSVGLGWAEPQSSNTTFTDNAIAGTFVQSGFANDGINFDDGIGVLTVHSDGTISGYSLDAWQGGIDWMSPLPTNPAPTYTWDQSYKTYGLIDISADKPMNCIAITSGTTNSNKFVCVQQSGNPKVMIMQE